MQSSLIYLYTKLHFVLFLPCHAVCCCFPWEYVKIILNIFSHINFKFHFIHFLLFTWMKWRYRLRRSWLVACILRPSSLCLCVQWIYCVCATVVCIVCGTACREIDETMRSWRMSLFICNSYKHKPFAFNFICWANQIYTYSIMYVAECWYVHIYLTNSLTGNNSWMSWLNRVYDQKTGMLFPQRIEWKK